MPWSTGGAWWQPGAKLVKVWWWEVAARDGEKWDVRARAARGTAHLTTRLETHSGCHYSTPLLCSANVCCRDIHADHTCVICQINNVFSIWEKEPGKGSFALLTISTASTVLCIPWKWMISIQCYSSEYEKKEKEELHFFPLLFTFQCNGKKMRSLTQVPAGLVKIYCTSLNSWVNTIQPSSSFTM